MKILVEQIFGTYAPTYYQMPIRDTSGNVVQIITTGSPFDVSYIVGVLLFAIVLYSFLRIVGVFLNK